MAVFSSGRPAPAQPLPEKIVALVNEARWLLLAALGLYLALVLGGFDLADPGWSHGVRAERVSNPGGWFGAWLADMMLYFFGFSAWWWVLFLMFLVAWGYRRLEGLLSGDRRPFLIAGLGFLLVLGASCGLEAMRFWSLSRTTIFDARSFRRFSIFLSMMLISESTSLIAVLLTSLHHVTCQK